MRNLIGTFLVAALCCTLTFGHGGTYRGPGDTVPPGGGQGGGGGGPNTPGPAGPAAPGPGGPNTPGPAGPAAPGQGPGGPKTPTTGAISDSVDLTQWSFWWEFNKDPYLALKNKIHKGGPQTGGDDFFLGHGQKENATNTLIPGQADIETKIVPALLNALETQTNNDIITGCLMSLAKIGNLNEEDDFGDVIVPFLSDSNQEISETAALALGILGSEEHIELLNSLISDTPYGREAVGRTNEVPFRTRSFAVYALGLIANKSSNAKIITSISFDLQDILAADQSSYKDVKIAAVVSMSLLSLDQETRKEQVDFLLEYFRNESNNHLVRAHIPEAISYTIAGAKNGHYLVYKEILATEFMNRLTSSSKEKREVQQSCVLGLGLLGDADKSDLDKKIRKTLYDIPTNVSDQQTRAFALISLANIGSTEGEGTGYPPTNTLYAVKEVQDYLTRQVTRGKSFVKPWASVSLGIMANHLNEAKLPVPSTINAVLRKSIKEERTPTKLGAASVAAGLAGHQGMGELLLEKLDKVKDAETQGYLCVSLGLLNHRAAIEQIKEIVVKSKYRPALLQQAAIGIGLMGDHSLVPDLVGMLRESKSSASQASIVTALAFIGDSRSIDPLVALLNDENYTKRARGFAAAALGMVADRMLLPWNSDLSCDLNYRASTPTLNDLEGTGILNIL